MTFKFHLMSGAALAVLTIAPAMSAHAQSASSATAPATGVQEVVVTATKTGATNLQKTPIAISVVGGNTLVQDQIKNARDLVNEVSSLRYTVNNVTPEIYVRGIGGYVGAEAEADVSVYIDGVYLARTTVPLQTDFNDLERVEVLEGPQGVEFGRNAVGGAINFITKAPPDHFEFEDTLNLGNYNLVDEAFRIGGPLLNNLQGSLSISHVQHDGFTQNVDPAVGGRIDAANRTGVRAKLKWEPTSDITDTLTGTYYWTHEAFETADEVLLPTTGLNSGSFRVAAELDHRPAVEDRHAVLPLEAEQAYGVTNELNWKIDDHFSMKSITALLTDWSLANQGSVTDIVDGPTSGAFTVPPAMVGIAASGGGAGSLIPTSLVREYQFSQEFNLLDTFGPLSGVLGYYAYDDHERFQLRSLAVGGNVKTVNPTAGTYTFENNFQPTISNAVFISQTYHITPTLSINAGVRYDWEHKTLNIDNITTQYEPGVVPVYPAPGNIAEGVPAGYPDPFIADLNQDAHATTPKVNVTWQATPDAMLYATASEGYHSGGYSFTARIASGASYGPELLWAYEGGAKTEWFDHSLRVNVAVFRYIWSGLQFSALISNTPSISVTSNAGRASLNGLEATVVWKPQAIEGLSLTGSATLLSSRYDYFPSYSAPGGLPSIGLSPKCAVASGLKCTIYNATGNQLVNAPDVSLVVTAQKDFDLGNVGTAFVRGEWSYTSTDYFDPTDAPIASQPAYSLLNASIGFHPARYSNWTFTLWGKNLTNQNVNEGYAAGSIVETTPGEPLTFGVRINYKY